MSTDPFWLFVGGLAVLIVLVLVGIVWQERMDKEN